MNDNNVVAIGFISCCVNSPEHLLHLDVQELRELALACCLAAKTLHAAGVVHRDLRLENVVRLDEHHWCVIDLEHAGEADRALPIDYKLRVWDETVTEPMTPVTGDTPVEHRYTTLSDMVLIGRLLRSAIAPNAVLSPYFASFLDRLAHKQLSAEEALGWLRVG